MGYYIQTEVTTGKAEYLIEHEGAQECQPHQERAEDEALVCVVENGLFDAAGICFSDAERDAFNDPTDPRPKTWLVMLRSRVIELCPQVEQAYAQHG